MYRDMEIGESAEKRNWKIKQEGVHIVEASGRQTGRQRSEVEQSSHVKQISSSPTPQSQ